MYDAESADGAKQIICEQIAAGQSLRAICAADGMPSERTVYDWLSNDSDFSQRYAHAREAQADFYADEIIEIADQAQDAQKARLQVDARKWKASKLQPKKYGDKIDVNHSGSIETMSEDQVNARLSELFRKAGIDSPVGTAGPADPVE